MHRPASASDDALRKDMTRIDFHSNVPEKIPYACRLVRKALAADYRVVLLADRADIAPLDAALWSFSEQDFLPHVMADDALAARTPVILTADDAAELPHHQVLINLSSGTPAHFARFERLFEIISSEETDAAAGRERYRFYKQRGYPLTHHGADKT
jgi:DNA polymerase-3 subunit chi